MTSPIRVGGHTLPEPEDDEGHWSDAEEDREGQTSSDSRLQALVQPRPAKTDASPAAKACRSGPPDDIHSEDKAAEDEDHFVISELDDGENPDGKVVDRSQEDSQDSSDERFEDESGEDYGDYDEDFEQSTSEKPKRSHGANKVAKPSQKQLGKRPAKSTFLEAKTQSRKPKPPDPEVLIWPTTIITTGTAGHSLRPVMAEMGAILTTDAEREEYMYLVWTRRRAVAESDDAAANQLVVDDLENFVRAHRIVDLHNLWARWMESDVKVEMSMYKPVGTGLMDATERNKMFERKTQARRDWEGFVTLR